MQEIIPYQPQKNSCRYESSFISRNNHEERNVRAVKMNTSLPLLIHVST